MQFLKRHYEKILLSVVLLALAGAAAWLPMAIGKARESLAAITGTLPGPKEIKPVDVTPYEGALQRLKNPPTVNFAGAHNLFNPVTWKQKSDGSLLKIQSGNEEGPAAVKITRIFPLHLIFSFERVSGTGYYIGVHDEAVPGSRKAQRLVSLNAKTPFGPDAKTQFFAVREAKGPAEDPTELILELGDTNEKVSVTKEKPFKRVQGYAADMKYDVEGRTFNDVRVGSNIVLGGEAYKVVAISSNEVRVSSVSTTKQTTLTWSGVP
jgi:hypothetical protein